MALIIALVLGLAAAGTQESLTEKNFKKLDRFPAIQSFVKHLYAHEIQGMPHGRGSHQAHDEDKRDKSNYMNIQNMNVILKHNNLKTPFEYVAKLRPRHHLTGTREKKVAVARCNGNKCDNDDREDRLEVKEDFPQLLNNMQRDDNVEPVFPYWGSSGQNTLNDARDSYNEPRHIYDLKCGCSKNYQREELEENGQYDLRCGCSPNDRMEENGQYELRCDCSKNYQRKGRGYNGQYDLRCGCDETEPGRSHQSGKNDDERKYDLRCGCSKNYQRQGRDDSRQYDLRCGCKKRRTGRSEMEDERLYDLRCGCSKNNQREGKDDGTQYDLRCGCDEIGPERSHQSGKNDDGSQYDLRCGCSKNYQREGRDDSMQYDLRCGCKKRRPGRSEIMDGERQYDLRCGCSRNRLDNNGQYGLRCGCDEINSGKTNQRKETDDYDNDFQCGCSNNYHREGRDDVGQYDLRCGCSRSSQRQRMDDNGQYELRCGCSKNYQREGVNDNEKYDLRCGCDYIRPEGNRQGIIMDSNEQYDLRCGCSRISQRDRIYNHEQYDLRCGCSRSIPKENTIYEIGTQAPIHNKNEVVFLNLDDIIDKNSKQNHDNNYNDRSNHVAKFKDWRQVHPDSVYMGLDPDDKYFGKVNKAMQLNVNPQDLISFYNNWKSMTTNNLLAYVLRQNDNVDLSRLSKMQRRIINNLRNSIPQLQPVDIRKLKNRLGSLLFGVESESVVLPHDEQNYNVYVPRWTHRILKEYKSNQKDALRRPRTPRVSLLPLTKKKKMRLQMILQKQIQANANSVSPFWRRSSPQNLQDYGVPFEMEVQALGQVNA